MSEQQALVMESEAGFKALFEYATIGILVINTNGHIALANPCIENLFGYANAELIGQAVEILIPEAFRERHIHHRECYFNQPAARPMGYGLSLYAQKKDGTEFPVEISLGYYRLDNEMLAVAFITDITDRKKLQEELETKVKERTIELSQSLIREKELNEIKSHFVSMASHEFRTPLSAILLSASLIELYNLPGNEEKREKQIQRIKSSVQNLTNILTDFLSLEKIEHDKIEIVKESFDLSELAADLVEEVTSMLKPGQHVVLSYFGNKEVFQDKKILRYVFLNLLSNALKYSPENKAVTLMVEVSNKLVSIKVKDEGIGIPEEDQKNLFKKFFRAKNVGAIQGTGLGLNITKQYVDLLKGHIGFVSTPGAGTVFSVEFPSNDNSII